MALWCCVVHQISCQNHVSLQSLEVVKFFLSFLFPASWWSSALSPFGELRVGRAGERERVVGKPVLSPHNLCWSTAAAAGVLLLLMINDLTFRKTPQINPRPTQVLIPADSWKFFAWRNRLISDHRTWLDDNTWWWYIYYMMMHCGWGCALSCHLDDARAKADAANILHTILYGNLHHSHWCSQHYTHDLILQLSPTSPQTSLSYTAAQLDDLCIIWMCWKLGRRYF